MKHIPLNVLIDALSAIEMLREVADKELTGSQFLQALKSWSALQAHVKAITQEINIEVAS